MTTSVVSNPISIAEGVAPLERFIVSFDDNECFLYSYEDVRGLLTTPNLGMARLWRDPSQAEWVASRFHGHILTVLVDQNSRRVCLCGPKVTDARLKFPSPKAAGSPASATTPLKAAPQIARNTHKGAASTEPFYSGEATEVERGL